MAQIGTLNVRLSESLKRHGCEVLERYGVSTSDAIRTLFEYLEREQKLPDQLFGEPDGSIDARRILMREMVGCISGSLASSKNGPLSRMGM